MPSDMSHHDAVKKLVQAEKALRLARTISSQSGVIEEIDRAYSLIYDAGDMLLPGVINEARKNVGQES